MFTSVPSAAGGEVGACDMGPKVSNKWRGVCDWPHHEPIGGDGLAGGGSGEQRRRGHGGAPAVHQILVRKLCGDLGKPLEGSVDDGS
jgi:hypothetical protein